MRRGQVSKPREGAGRTPAWRIRTSKVLATMFPNFSPELVAEVAKSSISRAPKGGVVSAVSIENLNKIVVSSDDTLKAITLQEAFDPSLLKD